MHAGTLYLRMQEEAGSVADPQLIIINTWYVSDSDNQSQINGILIINAINWEHISNPLLYI